MSRPLAAIFSLSTFLSTSLFLGTFLITFPRAAFAQSEEPASADSQAQRQASATKPPAFDIADVEISAPRRFPYKSGGDLRGGRYVVRDATLTDLISAAYGLDADNVLGGPSWLETDRFDVIAKTSPVTSPDALKLMLQSLLADRFKLVVHPDSKPLQVYVLSANGKPKFRESSGSGSGSCQPNPPPPPGSVPQISVTCHGVTTEALAEALHDMAGGYLDRPVVNSTGLDGTYDMDIKWTPRGALTQASSDAITIFDAVDKQLGLKLELQKVARPVIVVDSVNEKPTANSSEVATILPPAPPAAFDVAVIKPTNPDNTNLFGRMDGGQLTVQGATLKFLINFAWDLNPSDDEMLVNQPKWIEADHWDIIAKADIEAPTNGKRAPQLTQEDLQQMLRALLMDRFKLQVHIEERPISAYTLLADKPKLTPGDPTDRTRCIEGPGKDGKDPRIANPILGRLLTCQNMSMGQFSGMLTALASGYIFVPVKDETNLRGGYDFTLSFSTAGQLANPAGPAVAPTDGNASDPSGAISLLDAVHKQLGLKLVKEIRPASVLVIDHLEQKPTDN
jgi:uncharacterized protein (TIGR03435 family)